MDCKINMKAISGSLRKFNVYESSSEFMKVASDKFEKEYHIIRIDKNQICSFSERRDKNSKILESWSYTTINIIKILA